MKKRFFKSVLSLVLVLCMVMPSSLLTAQAAEKAVYEYEEVAVTNPVAHSWHVTTGTSGDGPASWAFDGNAGTHWHSNYGTAAEGNPNATSFTWTAVSTIPEFATAAANREWIGGEFGKAINFAKMEYAGRTGKAANWYGQYALYLANVTGREVTDADFELAASGTNGGFSKVVISLAEPKQATHFRLVAFTANPNNNTYVTASEIDVFEAIVADTTPKFGGSIVDTDTQYTQDRLNEVEDLTKTSEELTVWKNDKAVSEIALYSKYAAYDNVTVTAADLTDGNGNTISKDNVTASFIRSTKAYNGSYLGYGSPDRVIPADNGTNRSESSDIIWTTEPTDIAENKVQPVWVEFDIPEDAEAGVYTTTLTVTADDLAAPLTFDYTVEVQDAVLDDPEDYAFEIMQWQYPYSSAEYYDVEPFSPEHFEILESIVEIYKEVGGNAVTTTFTEEAWSGQTYSANPVHYPSMVKWTKNADGSFSYDYSDFDAWVSFCKEHGLGDKIVAYGIAPWHASFTYWTAGASTYTKEAYSVGNARYIQVWTDFLTDFAAHLEEKGWKENVYIGIDERGLNAAAFDVAEAAGLKTAADIDNISRHWDIAVRVTDLNVGDTAAQTNGSAFESLLAERNEKGYRTTLYSCTEHQPGNFSLSAPVESYWTVLNAGMMGTAGFNRWAYDAWVADPLNDATHNSFEPGDCFVIFPDEKDAENPTAKYSVRLARMAEGIRDVNKLAQMVEDVPSLSDEVAEVYANIQYALKTSRSYLNDAQVADLAAETHSFKADLNELTEKYIALRDGGSDVVESVVINEGETLTMVMGTKAQLSATVNPETIIDNRVIWTTSSDRIVTVSENGELTAVQAGEAVITAASALNGAKKDSITVTVEPVKIDDSKLVAYYSFDNVTDGTLKNEWADDRNGTIAESATLADGKQGKALSVNTAGEGAVIADSSDFDNGDWTVGYWVNTTADFNKEISVLEDSTLTYSLSLKMAESRTAGFRVGNGSGDVLTYKNCDVTKGTWYHLTWVQDKDTGLTLYVNGQRADSNPWPASHNIKAPLEVIGGTGFTGLIDEVKIYNAVLTESEIAASMQVRGINLLAASAEIMIDDTYQIEALLVSDNEDKTLTYTSADEKIATVDENGLVTGVGRGSTTITVTNEATGFTAELKVKVSVEISIINHIPRYVLPEKYQSDVEGPYPAGHARRYLGQPDMVQTETGRLITVFPTGHGHGPLVMEISDDQGETWTEKTNIPASWAKSQETPTIYSLQIEDETEADGYRERLVLVCACPNWDLNLGGWQMSYSDDNGETWTEFENFWQEVNGSKHYTIVAMASLIQINDEDGNPMQKWMGVYHDYGMVNYKTYLTFDEEGNPEWSKPEPYLSEYRQIESSHQICEVGLFRSPDGERIVGLARNQSHAGPATMFYSDDEGETWTEPVELPGSLAGERHKALYDPVTGKLVITFREIIYDRNGNGIWEGGSDWICGEWVAWVGTYEQLMNLQQGEYLIILDEDFSGNYYSGDTGYTGMAVLDDGTFVLHSYGHWDPASANVSDVRTDLCWIRQAKFNLAEVEEELKAANPEKIRVACVGDSLTDGYKSTGGNKSAAAYPARLQQLLGSGYEVQNFGKTSMTLMKDTNKSYWNTTEFANSLKFEPNVVIIMLGTNDSKAAYWDEETFKADARALVAEYQKLETNPRIIFATSPHCFVESGTDITGAGVDTMVAAQYELIEENGWETVDMYALTEDKESLYNADKVHFTDNGYYYIAQRMFTALTGEVFVDPADSSNDLPTTGMKLEAGSLETTEGSLYALFDGDESTFYHSNWSDKSNIPTAEDFWLVVELPEVTEISGMRYLPRQSSPNGRILSYEISYSLDGENWTEAVSGDWADDFTWKMANFEENVEAKFVKIFAVDSKGDTNGRHLTGAELRVLKAVEEPDVPVIPEDEVCNIFTDVAHGAWYEGAVQYVYDGGIMFGDNGAFSPDLNTTRAMVSMILYRLEGSPKVTDYTKYNQFTDVAADAWYADAVAWALNEGLATGDDYNMLYNPDAAVTREQLVTFLYRYAEYAGKDVTVEGEEADLFGGTYVSEWAKAGFAWAIENEIIKGAEVADGAGNTYLDLDPQGGASRAQLATVLQRYLGAAN